MTPGLSLCVGDKRRQCFSLTGSRFFQLAAVHQCVNAVQDESGIVVEQELQLVFLYLPKMGGDSLKNGLLRFADYFFDGLFADWAVGDRISESQSSVMSVRYKIEQAMNKLTSMDQAADKQIAALKAKIEELVIHS